MIIEPEHQHAVCYVDGSRLDEDASFYDTRRVIFSGRLRSGKDHVAGQMGLPVFGFADPIYLLTEAWIGSQDKSRPGVRRAMQRIGAWGRGLVSNEYPLTAERRRFCEWAQVHGPNITGVGTGHDWANFGTDWQEGFEEFPPYNKGEFWIHLLKKRTADKEELAITNGRFPNEIKAFARTEKPKGVHIHVMCSEKTRKSRVIASGEEWDPYAENDTTEQMAAQLDEYVYAGTETARQEVARRHGLEDIVGPGNRNLVVVWNDPQREPAFPPSGLGLTTSTVFDYYLLGYSPLLTRQMKMTEKTWAERVFGPFEDKVEDVHIGEEVNTYETTGQYTNFHYPPSGGFDASPMRLRELKMNPPKNTQVVEPGEEIEKPKVVSCLSLFGHTVILLLREVEEPSYLLSIRRLVEDQDKAVDDCTLRVYIEPVWFDVAAKVEAGGDENPVLAFVEGAEIKDWLAKREHSGFGLRGPVAEKVYVPTEPFDWASELSEVSQEQRERYEKMLTKHHREWQGRFIEGAEEPTGLDGLTDN